MITPCLHNTGTNPRRIVSAGMPRSAAHPAPAQSYEVWLGGASLVLALVASLLIHLAH